MDEKINLPRCPANETNMAAGHGHVYLNHLGMQILFINHIPIIYGFIYFIDFVYCFTHNEKIVK